MKFSVFQVSRKGGRQKNEDRMGYCYTRESGLFVLADGMGGHPEGEVAAQLALQTISALYQREARPVVKDVNRPSCPRADGGAPPDHPLRRQQGHARHAAHHAGRGRRCRAPRPPGCTAATRACTWCATASCSPARATTPTWSSTAPALMPDGAHQPQHAVHLPGLAHQAPVRRHRPGAAAAGRQASCCAPTACGAALDDSEIVRHLAAKPVSEAVPDLVEMALRNGGATATTSP